MDTRDAIIETAFILYLKKGFNGVSMNELLEEAGITKGGFYYYFESKDVLLAEVIKKYMFSYYNGLISYIENYQGSPKEKLRMLFFSMPGVYADYVKIQKLPMDNTAINYRSLYLLMMDGVQKYEVIRKYYEEFHIKLLEIVGHILEECKEQGIISRGIDSREISQFILACIHGTFVMWMAVPGISLEESLKSNYNSACKCMGIS